MAISPDLVAEVVPQFGQHLEMGEEGQRENSMKALEGGVRLLGHWCCSVLNLTVTSMSVFTKKEKCIKPPACCIVVTFTARGVYMGTDRVWWAISSFN